MMLSLPVTTQDCGHPYKKKDEKGKEDKEGSNQDDTKLETYRENLKKLSFISLENKREKEKTSQQFTELPWEWKVDKADVFNGIQETYEEMEIC